MPDKCKRCNDKGYLQAEGAYCPDCNGQGIGPYHPTDTVKCKTCDGSGRIGRPLRKGEANPLLAEVDYDQITVYESCPDCTPIASPIASDSIQRRNTTQCTTCGGGGKVWTGSILPHDCPDCDLLTSPMKNNSPDQSGDAKLDSMIDTIRRAHTPGPNPDDDMIDHIPAAGQKVEPPQGYETWLEAAIACMDTVAGIDAARAELAELRAHVNDRVDKAWNNGYKIGKVAGHRAAKEIDDA